MDRLNYKHSKEEVAEMNKLSGIERVRRSLCLEEHLLPEEDTRVFSNVCTIYVSMRKRYHILNYYYLSFAIQFLVAYDAESPLLYYPYLLYIHYSKGWRVPNLHQWSRLQSKT